MLSKRRTKLKEVDHTFKETDKEDYDDEDQKNVDQNDEGQNEDDANRALVDLKDESITKR